VGFVGLYLLLGLLFLLLVGKIIKMVPNCKKKKIKIMEFFWYVVLMGILAVYVVLDGYDFGAELFIYFTKTEKDKKAITNAIGPLGC
jgi:FtsH-binding integral membrane protein